MQTIKPSINQVFCKRDEVTKFKSGILLKASAYDKPKFAKVINTGESVTEYTRGDHIVFKSYAISEVRVNDDDYFLIASEDILGTIIEVGDEL